MHSQSQQFDVNAFQSQTSQNRTSVQLPQSAAQMHDLSQSPFVIKYDFNSKNTVKSLSITSDQKIALFNITKQIYFMDIKDILKTKEKIKGKINYLPSRIDYNEQSMVECNPLLPNIAATISNQATTNSNISNQTALIYDIHSTKEPEILKYGRPQFSLSWNQKESNLLGTTSFDKILLWDIRQTSKEISIVQTQPLSKILFDRMNYQILATLHTDRVVRIWDQRQLAHELYSFDAHESEIKTFDFDHQYGRLLMVAGSNQIRIFKMSPQSAQLQAKIPFQKIVVSAQFLPFGPGLAVLTEKSDSIEFHQLYDNEDKDKNLPISSKKRLMGDQFQRQLSQVQQQQQQQMQDIKLFKLRKDPETSKYHIISLSSDKWLKIQKIDNEFVKNFSSDYLKMKGDFTIDEQNQRNVGGEPFADQENQNTIFQQPNLTQCEIIMNEINQIGDFERIAFDDKETDPNDDQIIISMGLRLILNNKVFGVNMLFPRNYPEDNILFEAGNSLNFEKATVDQLINLINKLALEKASQQQPHIQACFSVIKAFMLNQVNLDYATASFPYQLEDAYYNLMINQNNENNPLLKVESKPKQPEKEQVNYFVPYVRTNGFCWNSKGQMVFYAYQKYNFRHLNQRPQRKKLTKIEEINNICQQISQKNNNWAGGNQNQNQMDYDDQEVQSESDYGDEQSNNLIPLSNRMVALEEDDSDFDENEDDIEEYDIDDESSYMYKSGTDRLSKATSDNILLSSKTKGGKRQKKKSQKFTKAKKKNSNNLVLKSKPREDNFFATSKASLINIFNLESLFPVSLRIAQHQKIFSNEIKDLCHQNYEKNMDYDKVDVARAWNLISICIGDINSDLLKLKNWSTHPLGKGLALRLLRVFEKQKDIQNLALLAALILGSESKIIENLMEAKQHTGQCEMGSKKHTHLIAKTKSQGITQESNSRIDTLKKNASLSNFKEGGKVNHYQFPRTEQEEASNKKGVAQKIKVTYKVQTPKRLAIYNQERKKSTGTFDYLSYEEKESEFDWIIHNGKSNKKKKSKQSKFAHQNSNFLKQSNLEAFTDYGSPYRNKNQGVHLPSDVDGYRNSYMLDEEAEKQLQNTINSQFKKKSKLRKSSTPDRKKKDRINLFEINNVDYLVDRNAIQIQDIDENQEEQKQFSLQEEDNQSKLKGGKQNPGAKSLQNYKEQYPQSMKDEMEDRDTTLESDEEEEVHISMIMRDEPLLTQQLLLYMKLYAETLMSWGLQNQSIELCKICAKVDTLLQSNFSSIHDSRVRNSRQIFPRSHFSIKDYLPFSEYSLGYTCETQRKHSIFGVNSCNNCEKINDKSEKPLKINIECSICNMRVKGLLMLCRFCNHGGHYHHMKDWFEMKSKDYQQIVPCPTGCGCNSCFTLEL